MYTIGNTDRQMVMEIQRALGLSPTGVFDKLTEQAVLAFQMKNHLVATGVAERETLGEMGILTTDLKGRQHFIADNLVIQMHYLSEGEFIRESAPVLNEYLILHHTAGWNDPFRTIDDWNSDKRGAIGTEFIIGGQRITNDDNSQDGVIVQAHPAGCRAWHVGSPIAYYMNRHSVGIECCNFGWLTDLGKNYVGIQAKESQITTLTEPFAGHTKFHRYSDTQLYSLKRLIQYVASRDSIDIRKGLIQYINAGDINKAFGYNQVAAKGDLKGMFVHGNVLATKDDMHPQPELIDMLLSL